MNVTGISDTISSLESLRAKLLPCLAYGVDHAASIAQAEIRKRCPVNTGTLRDSIHKCRLMMKGDRIHCSVIVDGSNQGSHYVADVEYGNYHQAPEPFIRPGFRLSSKDAYDAIVVSVKDVIEREG